MDEYLPVKEGDVGDDARWKIFSDLIILGHWATFLKKKQERRLHLGILFLIFPNRQKGNVNTRYKESKTWWNVVPIL